MVAVSRREQNKEQKKERILAAASELFVNKGVDEVTTQEIADAANIGAGTLFLYAKNKGELLLMVQNAHYSDALAQGVAAAEKQTNPVEIIMAIVSPIAVCNRAHVGNGRAYLKEMLFGDPAEPHHARALEIVIQTEAQLASNLLRVLHCDDEVVGSIARAVTALLLRYLATPEEISGSIQDILLAVRKDVAALVE